MTQPASVLFREIHKNAWLKKLPPSEKRNGAFPKKSERLWVVFCVHDDSEAFLEMYSDQKLAVTHKPDWFVSLNNCLHVSPTICAQEDEYEFVITLSSDVIRLTAPSWEMMMEWVETIRLKLQEMRILSPRENLYSKMPEARQPLAPTRDPNSPLPPPPMGPSALVPGIEPVHVENSVPDISTTELSRNDDAVDTLQPSSRGSGVNFEVRSTALYITQSEPAVYTRPRHVLNRAASVPEPPLVHSPSAISEPHSAPVSNVTVIEVSSDNSVPSLRSSSQSPCVFNFNFMEDTLSSLQSETANNIQVTHQFSEEELTENFIQSISSCRNDDDIPNSSVVVVNSENDTEEESVNAIITNLHHTESSSLEDLSNGLSHYECVFLPAHAVLQESSSQASTNATRIVSNETNSFQSSLSQETSYPTNIRAISNEVNPQSPRTYSVTSSPVSHDDTSQGTRHDSISFEPSATSAPQRRRSRSSSASEGAAPPVPSKGRERSHNTGAASGHRSDGERRLQIPSHSHRQVSEVGTDVMNINRLTLREQQVLQLRREMRHPGGVRLQLPRKDCVNSLALVDAFGAVWVAGWKQKEHPMLYNAFHIGDQIISTEGILVQNACDAQKFVRGTTNHYIEFVIRRVPCGRVFAIRRDTEGQSLGIIQEGNTAEIRDVVPGSPAARHGLVPRAQTCDGLSLTNWVLTEINRRPLNLFFKDGEVRDRLNAVGRDISILVQPADLVKQLKKQLKSIRGYKDYIVQ